MKIKYNKNYTEKWIKNYESKKDVYRVKYLEPYFKKLILNLPEKSKILDVGCGWGTIVSFLKKSHEYVGIDIAVEFFSYIKSKFKHKELILKYGKLPDEINALKKGFDLVICSMVLHTVRDLDKSIKALLSKMKTSGKVVLVDFNDSAEEMFRKSSFESIEKETKNYISGKVVLPSGIKVDAEVYFHKEVDFEKVLKKLGYDYTKKYIGPIFVTYEVYKK